MSKFVTRLFPRETLRCLLYEDLPEEEEEKFEVIKDEMYDTSRWSIHYDLVFKYEGKYYNTQYSRGATESQDESPFEYDGPQITCYEVIPQEVTTIEYVNVKL